MGGELKSTKVKTETASQSVSQCYPWDVPGGSHHHHYHHHCQSSQAWALTNLTSCGDWRYPATSLGKVILTATITSLSPSLHNYLPFLSLSHVIWRNWQWGRRELGLTVSLHFALIMKMKVHSCMEDGSISTQDMTMTTASVKVHILDIGRIMLILSFYIQWGWLLEFDVWPPYFESEYQIVSMTVPPACPCPVYESCSSCSGGKSHHLCNWCSVSGRPGSVKSVQDTTVVVRAVEMSPSHWHSTWLLATGCWLLPITTSDSHNTSLWPERREERGEPVRVTNCVLAWSNC